MTTEQKEQPEQTKNKDSMVPKKYSILFFVTLISVVLDQVTKIYVHNSFRLGESVSVIPGFFSFTYVRNTGAAFGILAQADANWRRPFFLIVPVIALVVIGMMLRQLPKNAILVSTALSLVVGGAIGNLIDRSRLGYVIDFIDFHYGYHTHFPAFNIADSAICIGVGLMFLDMFLQSRSEPGSEKSVKI